MDRVSEPLDAEVLVPRLPTFALSGPLRGSQERSTRNVVGRLGSPL
jgi:hypothetical protein